MGDVVRRIAFISILIYVTLDLSVPAMPGAFVFELDESVESAQTSRLKTAGEGVPLPAAISTPLASRPPVDDRHGYRPVPAVRRPIAVAAGGRLPRATLAPPTPSEDPL
jgi:hypothetical protein